MLFRSPAAAGGSPAPSAGWTPAAGTDPLPACNTHHPVRSAGGTAREPRGERESMGPWPSAPKAAQRQDRSQRRPVPRRASDWRGPEQAQGGVTRALAADQAPAHLLAGHGPPVKTGLRCPGARPAEWGCREGGFGGIRGFPRSRLRGARMKTLADGRRHSPQHPAASPYRPTPRQRRSQEIIGEGTWWWRDLCWLSALAHPTKFIVK